MKSILLIVARTPELVISEAQELVNLLSSGGYKVRLLQTMHSSLELYRALESSPFDLVWIAAHSSPEGFQLEDEILKPVELSLFLLEAKTEYLVLNSCYSVSHVEIIQKFCNANVIATIKPEGILDEDAWTAALYLGRAISRLKDPYAAYHQTLAGTQSSYRWFPAPAHKPEGTIVAPETSLDQKLRKLEEIVEGMVRALQGDSFSRNKGLIQAAEDFRSRMDTYIQSDQEWKRQTEERIRQIERDSSQGKTLVIPWRTAVYLALLFVACSAVLLYVTNTLQG